MTTQRQYVSAALEIMKLARTDIDLVEWWKGEKQNREILQLSPDKSPGLDLYEALKSYRNELRRKEQT